MLTCSYPVGKAFISLKLPTLAVSVSSQWWGFLKGAVVWVLTKGSQPPWADDFDISLASSSTCWRWKGSLLCPLTIPKTIFLFSCPIFTTGAAYRPALLSIWPSLIFLNMCTGDFSINMILLFKKEWKSNLSFEKQPHAGFGCKLDTNKFALRGVKGHIPWGV